MFHGIISTGGWSAPCFHVLGGQQCGNPPLVVAALTILLLIEFLRPGNFGEGMLTMLVLLR